LKVGKSQGKKDNAVDLNSITPQKSVLEDSSSEGTPFKGVLLY